VPLLPVAAEELEDGVAADAVPLRVEKITLGAGE
jgi:hypothetical protein